jgi:hypothetical protein
LSSCSVINLAEPMAGTAPLAQAWVLVEDNGPWGKKAPGSARFAGAPELAALVNPTPTSVLLVRQPHVRVGSRRRVWIAQVGTQQLFSGIVADVAELLTWDFEAIATGAMPSVVEPCGDFLWLVCTNSSRDACCALLGRPLIDDLVGPAQAASVMLLESSHLGGHRFAPTAMALPSGYVFGRLTGPSAVAAFEHLQNGAVLTENLRGRTNLVRWQQVADIVARRTLDFAPIDGLTISATSEPVQAGTTLQLLASTAAGHSLKVDLVGRAIGPRPESCGKDPVLGVTITATTGPAAARLPLEPRPAAS